MTEVREAERAYNSLLLGEVHADFPRDAPQSNSPWIQIH